MSYFDGVRRLDVRVAVTFPREATASDLTGASRLYPVLEKLVKAAEGDEDENGFTPVYFGVTVSVVRDGDEDAIKTAKAEAAELHKKAVGWQSEAGRLTTQLAEKVERINELTAKPKKAVAKRKRGSK